KRFPSEAEANALEGLTFLDLHLPCLVVFRLARRMGKGAGCKVCSSEAFGCALIKQCGSLKTCLEPRRDRFEILQGAAGCAQKGRYRGIATTSGLLVRLFCPFKLTFTSKKCRW